MDQGGDAGRVDVQRRIGQTSVRGGLVVALSLGAGADPFQVAAQGLGREAGVLAVQVVQPRVLGGASAVARLLRHVPDLETVQPVLAGRIAVPALGTVHARGLDLAVDGLLLGVDHVVLATPDVEILVVAGEQIGVEEADHGARHAVTVLALARLRHKRAEAPAIGPAPPLALGAADLAVEADLAGQHIAIGLGPVDPGVDIGDDPVAILRLVVQHVGVQHQAGGLQVQRRIADHVAIFVVVVQRLFVGAFAVLHEEVGRVEPVAGPVQGRGRTQHRTLAAGDHAADDLQLGIVVRDRLVLAGVEAREALHPVAVLGVIGIRQRQQVEHRQPFGQVLPVGHDREFAVVHALAGERHVLGLGGRVLGDIAVEGLLGHGQQAVAGAQRMQGRPVVDVLDGVVGTVIGAPALDRPQPAAIVEIASEECLASLLVGLQQLALQQRPFGRRHRRRDSGQRRGGEGRLGQGGEDQGRGAGQDGAAGSHAQTAFSSRRWIFPTIRK